MKRTPLARKTPLKRRNSKRAAKRKAEAFGDQADLCRQMLCPCCVPWAWDDSQTVRWAIAVASFRNGRATVARSEPHHIPSRGAGGADKDCVPLCAEHHREFHSIGEVSFSARHGVDLRAVAARIHEELAR